MALNTDNTFGDCCGRVLVYNFSTTPVGVDNNAKELRNILSRNHHDYEDMGQELGYEWRHLCVEVTLTSYQSKAKNAQGKSNRDFLEEFGFKLVYSFINANSGNQCDVYLYSENEVKSE